MVLSGVGYTCITTVAEVVKTRALIPPIFVTELEVRNG
jgi:hypothetical protein